jgi:hypothetical protein
MIWKSHLISFNNNLGRKVVQSEQINNIREMFTQRIIFKLGLSQSTQQRRKK